MIQKLRCLAILASIPAVAHAVPMVWLNEFHYDDASVDSGEFVEIAGAAGMDLAGYSIVLYNGNGGAPYNTRSLAGLLPDQANGFGTLSFDYPVNGIQNGDAFPDGIALVKDGTLLQFISYEGSFSGAGGPADGATSVDVGVFENGSQVGTSLGLVGSGSSYADFSWALLTDDTPGGLNVGQSFRAQDTSRVPDAFSTAGLLMAAMLGAAGWRRGRNCSAAG